MTQNHRHSHVQFTTAARMYLDGLRSGISNLDAGEVAAVADILLQLAARGGTGYVFGNGGSASTASHFANDVGKVTRSFPSVCPNLQCLNDNVAIMTAIANDDGYDDIFARQLHPCLEPRDLVIAISTRGLSKNLLTAVEFAKERNAESLAFVGYDGGKLSSIVDHQVLIPLQDMQQVEDLHLAVGHVVSRILWAEACGKEAPED